MQWAAWCKSSRSVGECLQAAVLDARIIDGIIVGLEAPSGPALSMLGPAGSVRGSEIPRDDGALFSLTFEMLQDIAAGAVAREDARLGGGGPVPGPGWGQYCLAVVEDLASALFPGGIKIGQVRDDGLVGAGESVRRHLGVSAAVWGPVTGWGALTAAVRGGGPGAAAFVVVGRPNRIGHALAFACTFDSDVVVIDPAAPGGRTVRPLSELMGTGPTGGQDRGGVFDLLAEHLGPLTDTRALIVTSGGQAIISAAARGAASTVGALTDPVDPRAGAPAKRPSGYDDGGRASRRSRTPADSLFGTPAPSSRGVTPAPGRIRFTPTPELFGRGTSWLALPGAGAPWLPGTSDLPPSAPLSPSTVGPAPTGWLQPSPTPSPGPGRGFVPESTPLAETSTYRRALSLLGTHNLLWGPAPFNVGFARPGLPVFRLTFEQREQLFSAIAQNPASFGDFAAVLAYIIAIFNPTFSTDTRDRAIRLRDDLSRLHDDYVAWSGVGKEAVGSVDVSWPPPRAPHPGARLGDAQLGAFVEEARRHGLTYANRFLQGLRAAGWAVETGRANDAWRDAGKQAVGSVDVRWPPPRAPHPKARLDDEQLRAFAEEARWNGGVTNAKVFTQGLRDAGWAFETGRAQDVWRDAGKQAVGSVDVSWPPPRAPYSKARLDDLQLRAFAEAARRHGLTDGDLFRKGLRDAGWAFDRYRAEAAWMDAGPQSVGFVDVSGPPPPVPHSGAGAVGSGGVADGGQAEVVWQARGEGDRAARQVLDPLRLERVEVARDGDCFFGALGVSAAAAGVGLASAYAPEAATGSLRIEDLRNWVAGQAFTGWVRERLSGFILPGGSWEGLAAWVRGLGNWADDRGDLVPWMAAWAFGIRIRMVGSGVDQMVGDGGPVVVLYRPDNAHWDATRPSTTSTAGAWTAGPSTGYGYGSSSVYPRGGSFGQASGGGAGGLRGGSRDAGVDPVVEGWPVGAGIVVDVAPRQGRLRLEEVPGRAAERATAGGGGKKSDAVDVVYAVTADWPRTDPTTSSTIISPGLYVVTASGRIQLPDGTVIPNGWIRHGIDFIQVHTGTVLRADSGWIGTITNADTLLAALREETDEDERYDLHAGTWGLFLIPTTSPTARAIEITGVSVNVPSASASASESARRIAAELGVPVELLVRDNGGSISGYREAVPDRAEAAGRLGATESSVLVPSPPLSAGPSGPPVADSTPSPLPSGASVESASGSSSAERAADPVGTARPWSVSSLSGGRYWIAVSGLDERSSAESSAADTPPGAPFELDTPAGPAGTVRTGPAGTGSDGAGAVVPVGRGAGLAMLQEIADAAVGAAVREGARVGGGGPVPGPEWGQYCLAVVEDLAFTLFPGGIKTGQAPNVVGTEESARRYLGVPAAAWGRVTGWGVLADAVAERGPGAAAFVVIGRPNRIGHALAFVRTFDGGVAVIDPSTPGDTSVRPLSELAGTDPTSGQEGGEVSGRLTERRLTEHLGPLTDTRALIVAPDGQAITPAVAFGAGSDVGALTDPIDPRIGAPPKRPSRDDQFDDRVSRRSRPRADSLFGTPAPPSRGATPGPRRSATPGPGQSLFTPIPEPPGTGGSSGLALPGTSAATQLPTGWPQPSPTPAPREGRGFTPESTPVDETSTYRHALRLLRGHNRRWEPKPFQVGFARTGLPAFHLSPEQREQLFSAITQDPTHFRDDAAVLAYIIARFNPRISTSIPNLAESLYDELSRLHNDYLARSEEVSWRPPEAPYYPKTVIGEAELRAFAEKALQHGVTTTRSFMKALRDAGWAFTNGDAQAAFRDAAIQAGLRPPQAAVGGSVVVSWPPSDAPYPKSPLDDEQLREFIKAARNRGVTNVRLFTEALHEKNWFIGEDRVRKAWSEFGTQAQWPVVVSWPPPNAPYPKSHLDVAKLPAFAEAARNHGLKNAELFLKALRDKGWGVESSVGRKAFSAVKKAGRSVAVSGSEGHVAHVGALDPLGLERVEVARDGDCFFGALRASAAAAGVRLASAHNPQAATGSLRIEDLRNSVADQAFTRRVRERLSGFIRQGESWDALAAWIRQPRNWADDRGDLVPWMAAWAFGIQIRMVGPEIDQMVGDGGPVVVLYRPDNAHWDATRPAATGPTAGTSAPGRRRAGVLRRGGSRDAGVDPVAEGWPVGAGIVVDVVARQGSLRMEEVAGQAAERAVGGGGKEPDAVYAVTADWPRVDPATSSSVADPDLYIVTSSGWIQLPDGTEIPNGWIRHGIDFIQEQTGTVLRADSGWIGTVTNADVLLAALREKAGDGMDERYHLHADAGGLYLILTTTSRAIEVAGVSVGVTPRGTRARPPGVGERRDQRRSGTGMSGSVPPQAFVDDGAGAAGADPRGSAGVARPPVVAVPQVRPAVGAPAVRVGGSGVPLAYFDAPRPGPDEELATGPAPTPDADSQPSRQEHAHTALVPRLGDGVAEAGAGRGDGLWPGGRPGFALGGVPAGVGWVQARWVWSWGLRFDPAGAGSLYAAVLAAGRGSVRVDGQVLRDPDEVRRVLGERMRGNPPGEGVGRWPGVVEGYRSAVEARLARGFEGGRLSPEQEQQIAAQIGNGQAWQQMLASVRVPGHWDELERIAPWLVSEYLGLSLLVLHADGRLSSYGSGSALVVAEGTGSGGVPRWAGVPAVVVGPVLGGLSGAQLGWAADAGMRFVGQRGGGDFFDALVAAGRASAVEVLSGDPQALRRALVRGMRTDVELAGSGGWDAISAEYARVRAAAGPGGEGDRGDVARVVAGADGRFDDGEAWQEIIADVSQPGRRSALTGALWPLLVNRYLGVSVRVPGVDGQVRSYGEGQAVTVAPVAGQEPEVAGDVWVGLAPVSAPRALGAGTRPADVAGGWSEPGLVVDFTDAARPARPAGPAGVSAAQQEWAWRHHRRFVEVPADADGFYNAVLQAAGGGFSAGGVFVSDPAQLRGLLVEKIQEIAGTGLDLWLVVHTIYAAQYRAAHLAEREQRGLGPISQEDARALAGRIDERIDDGQALSDIVTSIAEPGFWPELGDELAPYFVNQFGLGVRVVDPAGVVGRYGRGRPVYLASVAGGEGPRRWVALPPSATRFAISSPLSAPNVSDPVLVRLAQAVDARKAMLRATGAGMAAYKTDPVVGWLRGVRKRWLGHGSGARAAATGMPGGVAQWDPDWLAATVTGLSQAAGLGQVAGLGRWPAPGRGGGDAVGVGLSLSFAVELARALFPGGIGPARVRAEAGDEAAGQAGRPSGIPAGQWAVAPSLRELIGVVPPRGAALFLDGRRVWVAVDTTSGLRLVEFGPEAPTVGQVTVPTPALIASMASPVDGLALVIGSDGHTIGAEALDGPFAPAAGWADEPAAEASADTAGLPPEDLAAADADPVPARVSRHQYAWAREHRARFLHTRPGVNSFFEAVIKAAGGRLTGGGLDVTDAMRLRQALADHVRDKAASGRLRNPLIDAAYIFEAEERIIEEFFGHDLTSVDRKAVHRQIGGHFDTGAAGEYIEKAFADPGHWEQITELLAPDLLAERAGLSLLVIDPDGGVRRHGDAAGRRLALARTGTGPAGLSGWVAVVPETHEQATEPFANVSIDAATSLAEHTSAGAPAALNDHQQQVADEQQLRIEPTEPGADSFYNAVLAAAGGGFMLDRQTFIHTPTQLRQTLATLLRDRPDVLDAAAWQQIHQITEDEDLDTEEIIDVLTEPADHNTDRFARHLIGSYLDFELRVIEPDGTTHTHGTGRPITIAPTTGQHGQTHWAALRPHTPQTPQHEAHLPGLPSLADLDQPPITSRWDPDHYKLLEPGSPETEDPWRNSSFCVENEDGVLACVSVAVITLNHPLAANLTTV